MDALFRQVGIYAHSGQLYEPVDADNLLYYKEAIDGQILEEGITERTAVFHVNSAAHKLDCASKHQAVIKAMRLGLIH